MYLESDVELAADRRRERVMQDFFELVCTS